MDFFSKPVGPLHITKRKKPENKTLVVKTFMFSLYLLYIVNTSKNSHASKMLGIVGICVNNFNEIFVGKKKTLRILRRPYNEH